jgi:hypothetical protein
VGGIASRETNGRISASAGECPAAKASNKTGNKEVKKRRIFDMDFECQAGYRLPFVLQKGIEFSALSNG